MFGKTYEDNNKTFEPIPKGRYTCVLDNCTIEKNSNGNAFLDMPCTIVNGDQANRKLWVKLYFTEGAYNMTSKQLDNLGVFEAIEPAENIEGFCTNAAEHVFKKVGEKIAVSVTGHREYNDKKYEQTFIATLDDEAAEAVGVNKEEKLPF